MRGLVRFIARLYPARWRERYGAEFGILLEDVDPNWGMLFDIFKAAMGAQMRSFKHGRLIAGAALAGALTALASSYLSPDQYQSSAVLAMKSAVSSSAVQEMATQVTIRNRLTTIATHRGLYMNERSRMPMEDIIEHMKRNIVFAPAQDGSLQIRFTYPNRMLAQTVAHDLADHFLQVADAEGLGGALPESDSPARRVGPQRPMAALIGLLSGPVLGFGLTALLKWPFARTLTVFGLSGAAIGFGAAYSLPQNFRSVAVVQVNASAGEQSSIIARALSGYPQALREKITITPVSAHILQVAFSSTDRYAARRLAEDTAGRIIDDARESGTRSVSLLDRASLPTEPVPGARTMLTSGGLLFGLSFAIGMRLNLRRASRRNA